MIKSMIKFLCYLYFSLHTDTAGLVFFDEDLGGIKIKFEGGGEK